MRIIVIKATNDKPERNNILVTAEIRAVRNISSVIISDGLDQIGPCPSTLP